MALNWLITFHDDTVVVIPGATKESHVRENTAAMSFGFTDEDILIIDRESAALQI